MSQRREADAIDRIVLTIIHDDNLPINTTLDDCLKQLKSDAERADLSRQSKIVLGSFLLEVSLKMKAVQEEAAQSKIILPGGTK